MFFPILYIINGKDVTQLKKLNITDIDTLPYGTRLEIVYTIDGIVKKQKATAFNTKIGIRKGKVIEKNTIKHLMKEHICEIFEV